MLLLLSVSSSLRNTFCSPSDLNEAYNTNLPSARKKNSYEEQARVQLAKTRLEEKTSILTTRMGRGEEKKRNKKKVKKVRQKKVGKKRKEKEGKQGVRLHEAPD